MLEVAEAFDRSHPEIMVLIAAELSSAEWIRAMRAGVRDIVAPGAIESELPAAVRRALGAATLRRANLVGEPTAPTSRMITVLSPKGGAGKTTIATNLAVALADRRPGSTALVDLDLQFGDVVAALQLTPEHTLRRRRPGATVGRHDHAQGLPDAATAPASTCCARRTRRPTPTTSPPPPRPRRCGCSAPTCPTSWSTPRPGSTRHALGAIELSTDLAARLHARRRQRAQPAQGDRRARRARHDRAAPPPRGQPGRQPGRPHGARRRRR